MQLQKYPWVAHLEILTSESPPLKCGAAILDEFTVVSAAHCFVDCFTLPRANMRVRVSARIIDLQSCDDKPFKQEIFVRKYFGQNFEIQ